MKPLNVQKLRELCEAVVRDCKGAESKIYKAADESYANLGHKTLPELVKFITEK